MFVTPKTIPDQIIGSLTNKPQFFRSILREIISECETN